MADYVEVVVDTLEVVEVGAPAGDPGDPGDPGQAWDASWRGAWAAGTADYSANTGDVTKPADVVRGSDGAWYRAVLDTIPAGTDPTTDDGTNWEEILTPPAGGAGTGVPDGGTVNQLLVKDSSTDGDATWHPNGVVIVWQAGAAGAYRESARGTTVTVRPAARHVWWMLHDRPDGTLGIDNDEDVVLNISGSVWA